MVYRNKRLKDGPSVRIVIESGGGRSHRACRRKGHHMTDEHGGRRGRGPGKGLGKGQGQGRGRGHRGRPRRPLDHGTLRLLLLQLISAGPRHGYDLIREIEARTGGAYVPSPGVIYPALETLLDLGWVIAETEGSRRSFRVTEEGAAELEREADMLEQISARLSSLQERDAPEDPEDVRGAMRRLRHAVIQSVRANPEDADQRRKIADILSQAQDAITKLSEA